MGDAAIYFQRGGLRLGVPLEIWRVSFEPGPEPRLGAPELMFRLEADLEVFAYHAPTRRFVAMRRRTSVARTIVVETLVR